MRLFARLVALRRITLYKNKRKDSMFKLTAKALACALSLSIAGMAQAADPIVIKFSHVVADHCCGQQNLDTGLGLSGH